MDVSRRLEGAIRRLREAGDDPYTLEAAREEMNALIDEAAYSRRAPSPAKPSSSGFSRSATRLNHAERQMDSLQQLNTLQDEIRWVDEEASQARRELEDRLEARIVTVEARVTALTAMANETESRMKELERRADVSDAIAKRSRLTIEELAEKVSSVVGELQERVLSELNGVPERVREPVDPFLNPSPSVSHRYGTESLRPSSRSVVPVPASASRSENMVRELLARIEALEHDVDGERDRSIRAVELVANALTPSRLRGAPAISPDRPSSTTRTRRMSSSLPSASAASGSGTSRRLNGDDYAADSPRTSKHQ